MRYCLFFSIIFSEISLYLFFVSSSSLVASVLFEEIVVYFKICKFLASIILSCFISLISVFFISLLFSSFHCFLHLSTLPFLSFSSITFPSFFFPLSLLCSPCLHLHSPSVPSITPYFFFPFYSFPFFCPSPSLPFRFPFFLFSSLLFPFPFLLFLSFPFFS